MFEIFIERRQPKPKWFTWGLIVKAVVLLEFALDASAEAKATPDLVAPFCAGLKLSLLLARNLCFE